jgi:putative endonuclease
MRGIGARFVYVLESDSDPGRHYCGVTSDVDHRLEWHNHGPSGHTVTHRPWSLLVAIEFPTEADARRFERYLKTGSGRAFARRTSRGVRDPKGSGPTSGIVNAKGRRQRHRFRSDTAKTKRPGAEAASSSALVAVASLPDR